jgi:hypothetical protein
MVTRRTWLLGTVGALAIAGALTATFGHAASLGITSRHLTVLQADAEGPSGPSDPTCPVGTPVDTSCELVLIASADVHYTGPNPGHRVNNTSALVTNPHQQATEIFVRFDDLGSIPQSATVSSAKLRLVRHGSPPTARTYRAQPATSTWNETGTATARPSSSGSESSSDEVSASGSTSVTVSWDVEDAVGELRSGDDHGWRIWDDGSGNQASQFRPREYGTTAAEIAERPTLTITYTMP